MPQWSDNWSKCAVDVPDAACSGLSLAESSAKFVLCDASGGTAGYTIDPVAVSEAAPGFATKTAYANPCN